MKNQIRSLDGLAILVSFLPLSFLLIGNNDWLYAPLYSTDSYIYHAYSYFYDWPQFKSYSYKASRVPWVSFLFYLQKVVGPYLLQPVVVMGGWISINLAYYFTIKKVFNTKTALVLLPWIVFFPDMIATNAGGGTYHANITSLLFVLALYFWTSKDLVETKRFKGTILSSFILSTAIHIGIVHINLMLLLPIIDIYKNKTIQIKKYGALAATFIITTIVWGIINYLHGRDFLFWNQILKTTTSFVVDPQLQQSWWKPINLELIKQNGYLVFHLVLLAVALLKLLRQKLKSVSQNIFTYHYLMICMLWVIYHLLGHTALHPPDFVYPLQIPAFLMLASWISQQKNMSFNVYTLVGITISLWIALVCSEKVLYQNWLRYDHKSYLGLACLIVGLSIFLIKSKPAANIIRILIIILSYSVLNVESRYFNRECNLGKESNDVMVSITEKIQEYEKDPTRIFVFGDDTYQAKSQNGCENYWLSIPIHKIMHSAWSVVGNSLDYQTYPMPTITSLKKEDFTTLIKKDGLLVLFPFNRENYLEEFVSKANDLKIFFKVDGEFIESINGREFKTYLLRIKKN